MKRTYNPNRAPGKWWGKLDDWERQGLVERYHRKKRIELPNERLHAAMHVVVENQALLEDETPVAAALRRLQSEGLTRHDAIHAVATELSSLIFEIHSGGTFSGDDAIEQYYDGIRDLTKEKWLSEYGEESG